MALRTELCFLPGFRKFGWNHCDIAFLIQLNFPHFFAKFLFLTQFFKVIRFLWNLPLKSLWFFRRLRCVTRIWISLKGNHCIFHWLVDFHKQENLRKIFPKSLKFASLFESHDLVEIGAQLNSWDCFEN